MLFGSGFEQLSRWMSMNFVPGDLLRRWLVFSCEVIYFARICFTGFYLMHRTFSWGETVGVGLYIFFVEIFFGYLGGKNPEPVGVIAIFGVMLYVAGSYLNTGSEYMRLVWKSDLRNK